MKQTLRNLAATGAILASSLWLVFLATHITVNAYSGADGQRGVVVGWRGHAPGPIQCAGIEYGTHPGPFVNVDC